MSDNFFKIKKGLNLGAQASDPAGGAEGDFYTNNASSKMRAYIGGAWRDAVFADQTATLTNKTISGASNTLTNVDGDNVVVDPSGNLASTNVQAALVELQGDIDTNTTGLAAHLADTVDAHDASAISNVAAGNLAATDVQGALNELQGDIDTNTTGLAAHLADTVAAHDASAISSVASGNLAATDVQGALNELQTDVDTRATSSALTTHTGASSGVHGIAGSVVGTSDSQILSSKRFSDSISLAELATTPANAAAGYQKIYAKTDGLLYYIDDAGVDSRLTSEVISFALSGGTYSTDGTYDIYTFTSSNTLTVTGSGNVDYLCLLYTSPSPRD